MFSPRPPPVVGGSAVKLHVTDTPLATVFGNLTVVDAAGAGFTTAYPCATGRTNTSNSNFVAGQTIANFATVRADANGDICITPAPPPTCCGITLAS